MATDKKSFLLYCDLIHTVSKMPNDKAGELFKHILDYVNDHSPETDDLIIQLTFEPIKQQLKRDLKKWESIADRNKINGSKGGRPKNPTEPKKPIGLFGNPTEPRKAVSVNVNVTDTVTDNVNVKEKKLLNSIEFDFPITEDYEELIIQWLIYKSEKKQSYKKTGLKSFVLSLYKYSNNKIEVAREIVNKSISNNYSGIFELNNNKQINHPSVLIEKDRDYDTF